MLLPDNINPELSIYYNGAIVIQELKNKNIQRIFELYQNVNKDKEMSFSTFILSLDWLYLINVALINKNGEVELCL
ncbi:hypothetical protein K144313037_21670 [Clostridium tetani]|uniref:Uncharacterized protein n=1 Tax=Clostridium tetani TaxID=1513 RepID=A0A4Q0VB31_CLOTA|nr:ABC-three component system middle component 6 [Clostridium tetani]KGI41410.1 hypothetical protein KY55_14375 [Clostridium tetani]RXI44566.1 hypothetical protein DP130_13160 [Clostridium tetani]RXI73497.1 hypothetical protein DP127_02940 [Clostridium tetani]RXM74305.1 hypothetical protein DP154_12740 [Clostridium tetani]RYU97910.1 hypothetical protein DP144_13320 [Clostridium tetani]